MTGIQKDISYYDLYLRHYLRESGNPLCHGPEFITARANLASAEYERQRLAGASFHQAQEVAMSVLTDGLDAL